MKGTQAHILERARNEWGLARLELLSAVVAVAEAEDNAVERGVGR